MILRILIDETITSVECEEWLDAKALLQKAREEATDQPYVCDALDLASTALALDLPTMAEGYLHHAQERLGVVA